MRPFARVLFIALGGLLLLIALLIFGANLYLQSTFTQGRLQEQITRATHVPVQITSTSISPWSGLTVSGITVPQADAAIAGDLFQAKSLAVRFRLWPLFRRQFIVKEVLLTAPTIAWWQDEKGRWQLPIAAAKATPPPVEPAATIAAASPKPEASPELATKPAKKAPKFAVTLQNVELAEGNFYFYDHGGKLVASFENVNARAPQPKLEETKAKVKIETVTLRGPVIFENVESPFDYNRNRIALPALRAGLAGGQIEGSFRAHPAVEGTPFRTSITFSEVDLRRLLGGLSQNNIDIYGRAQGWMQLSGQMAKQDSLTGAGQLIIHGGQLRSYSLLQVLADALRIEELGTMDLKTAQLDYRIYNKRVWVDSLVLQSQNLRLVLWGSVRIGGQIKMQARLVVNSKISRQLPQFVENSFQPGPGPDERFIDFNITGKSDHPKTDLLDRLFGTSMEKRASRAIDLLRGFLGGEKGNKNRPGSTPLPTPTSTPIPSPSTP